MSTQKMSFFGASRRVFDLSLNEPLLYRVEHPAQIVDLLYITGGQFLDLIRQMLDSIRSPQRVRGARDTRFITDHLLRSKRNSCGVFGRQPQRFVHRVRMKRLRTPKYCRKRLNRRASDIHLRLLRRE